MTSATERQLSDILEWCQQTIAALSPARRRQLIRKLLVIMRQRNIERIRRNVDPDGQPWEARKRRRRRGSNKMMQGLAKARKMRLIANADAGTLGFGDNLIARVHHYGLRDKVSKNGPTVKYPARPLLGISDEDENVLMQELVAMFPSTT